MVAVAGGRHRPGVTKEEIIEEDAEGDLGDESHVRRGRVEDGLGAKERLAQPKDLKEVDR